MLSLERMIEGADLVVQVLDKLLIYFWAWFNYDCYQKPWFMWLCENLSKHEAGVVWFSSTHDPDMKCKTCGKDLR